uniref:Bis(5'-nucleosyl)-tetraphosphatase [asymmetrical] n=1 Tax=Syphacia muris TaxID=451379 RepID=A0A0N5AFL6_9BILA
MASVFAAGMLIYRKAGSKIEYLLLQASYPPFHWSPPKGHLDPGEDFMTAALRETKEEANISEEQLDIDKSFEEDLFYEVKQSRDNGEVMKKKQVKYWLARLKNSEDFKLSSEHQNFKWLYLEDAVEITKFPEMERLLRKAEKYLQEEN